MSLHLIASTYELSRAHFALAADARNHCLLPARLTLLFSPQYPNLP